MLKTATKQTNDPVQALIISMIGNGMKDQEIEPGLIEIGHFSPDNTYRIVKSWNEAYDGYQFNTYGVADSKEQALEYAKSHVQDLQEAFCGFVTHIAKDISNKGVGGGWRWCKWGEYIGTGSPQCEYLDDENGFDNGVWVFTIALLDEK